MKVRFQTLLGTIAQLVFCILFLFLFVNNSMLRPSAPGIHHKEYFIGAILLVMIYTNALFLYPKYYRCHRIAQYVLLSLLCIIVTLVAEFAWIYNDVIGELRTVLSERDAQAYFWGCTFFVFLRNAGFLAVTFLLCDIIWLRHKENRYDRMLAEKTGNITVEDVGGNTVLLKTNSIIYCEQEENYTKIYCKNNQAFTRYGSLTKTHSLLGTESFVQINRKTIVLKKSIASYNNGMLWILGEEKPFEVTTAYQYLFPDPIAVKQTDEKTPDTGNGGKETGGEAHQKEIQKDNVIFQLVTENPGISAVQLASKSQLSQSTTNRIIARLKKQGLIRHVGSNKTGGYEAANGEVGA